MVKEGDLPINTASEDPKLDDAEARARMMRTFERALAIPRLVLPIQRWNAAAERSARWRQKNGSCVAKSCFWWLAIRRSVPPAASIAAVVPPQAYPYIHARSPRTARATAGIISRRIHGATRFCLGCKTGDAGGVTGGGPGRASNRSPSRAPCAPR